MLIIIRIKLAIADKDESYVNRLSNFLNAGYSDKVEVYSFTQLDSLVQFLKTNKVDVLLASETMELNLKSIPERTAFAYLVDNASLETVNNKRAVCKFQKADLIYKEALSLFSENPSNITGFKSAGDGDTSLISFYSCSGGCGSSTAAAACCLYLAAKGKKVLYLNFERFGTPQIFFNASGSFTLSDIIFAIKSKKSSLALKLESSVKKDQSGVFFYDACRTPLDIFELTGEDIKKLINEIKTTGIYDYVIIDTDPHFINPSIGIMKFSNLMIFVSDGTEVANIKFKRFYDALRIIEDQQDIALVNKIALIYNKFRDNSSKVIEGLNDISVFGGVGVLGGESLQIAKQISLKNIFSSLC